MPTGIGGFFSGAIAVLRGVGKIFSDSRLRGLAVLPLLLTALLYIGLITVAVLYSGDLLARVWPQPDAGWLHYVWYVLVPFVFIAVLAPFALLFSTIAEAIGGPFYDKMATRVLSTYSIPAHEPGILAGIIPDIARSLMMTFAGATCALLALIPIVGLVFAAIGLVITWLGFAAAAINSALMVTGVTGWDRLRFLFRSFMPMAGIGAVVSAALLIPFAGLIAIPASVVGATDLYARALKRF